MSINPPIIIGPISECSRLVDFENAIPGATILLVAKNNEGERIIGKSQALMTSGTIKYRVRPRVAQR